MTEKSLTLQIEEALSKALIDGHSAFNDMSLVQENSIIEAYGDGQFEEVVKTFEETQENDTYKFEIDLADLDPEDKYITNACNMCYMNVDDRVKLNVTLEFLTNDGVYVTIKPTINESYGHGDSQYRIMFVNGESMYEDELSEDEIDDFSCAYSACFNDIAFSHLKLVDFNK